MTSEIRTNSITSRAGMSTVTMTDSGPMFSGITTFVDNSGFTFGVGGGTSIFTPATNVLTFGTNNTEKVRIDANGNTNITGVTTAANFKTGVSNLHDVGLTLSGGQIDVGSNIKIGTAGVVTATSFVGDGSNLTGLSGVSVANQANNRLITATGTTDALNGEANLTFDGSVLTNTGSTLIGNDIKSASDDFFVYSYKGGSDGQVRSGIQFDSTNQRMEFYTGTNERLRIHSGGIVTIGNDHSGAGTLGADLAVANVAGANIVVGDTVSGEYLKLKGTSGAAWVGSKSNHPLIFFTNGESNEHMRITHDTGAVGIGTNNPSYELEVHDGSGASAIRVKDGANNVICDLIAGSTGGHLRTTYNHPLKFSTNQVERMRINTDGSLLYSNNLASAVPSGQFGFRMDRGGGNGTIMNIENYSNDSVNNNAGLKLVTNHSNVRIIHHNQGGFYIINSGNGYLHYYSNGSSRVFIDTNGNVCVGTQSASVSTQAKGISLNQDGAMISRRDGVMHYYKSISTGGYYANVFMSAQTTVGSIFFNSGGTQFNTSSDYRRKENVVSLTDGLSKLKQLKPYRFNFKDNPSETVDGFLAHEAQEVVPHTVTGTKDQVSTADDVAAGIATTTGEPIYQQMDLSKLVPLLTASLQELNTKVETLEQENITLRARVTNLEGE